MPESLSRNARPNYILSRLSRADFGLLQPYLDAVDLPVRQRLETPNKRIDHIYFIESGFASVVANSPGDRGLEVGLIGREGMTGLAIVMATDRTPNETFMQLAGRGQHVTATNLRRAMKHSASLHSSLLNYGHAFLVQTSQTARATGCNKIEERLARWLLMAHDRADRDEFALTHEFLALMLGVRRPGVTVALNALGRAGLILANRGVITIVDRNGLKKSAKDSYGTPEAELQRLFGRSSVRRVRNSESDQN
jgi:CRP-like cAMP-binding protein